MGEEKAVPCSEDDVSQQTVSNCRTPVLFHRPTAIQVLDEQGDTGRQVHVLAAASTSAEIDAGKGESNPTLGEGETGLIIRIDYPNSSMRSVASGRRFMRTSSTYSRSSLSIFSYLSSST